MSTKFETNDLQLMADTLKREGLRVFYREPTTEEKPTYFFFTDGKSIGYCEGGSFFGVRFGTVHKPNRTTGTGYSLQNQFEGVDATIDNAKKAFCFAPNWARPADLSSIVKYASFDEYLSSSDWNKRLIEY